MPSVPRHGKRGKLPEECAHQLRPLPERMQRGILERACVAGRQHRQPFCHRHRLHARMKEPQRAAADLLHLEHATRIRRHLADDDAKGESLWRRAPEQHEDNRRRGHHCRCRYC